MLNSRQKSLLADKLMDLANLTFAALVIGQLIGSSAINKPVLHTGVAGYIIALVFSMILEKEKV